MNLESAIIKAAINGDKLSPEISKSTQYKHWLTIEDWRRCYECATKHGKIFLIDEIVIPKPPLHENCRCWIEIMKAIRAGTATINGLNGADWTLMHKYSLPDYYISQQELENLGWQRGDKISKFASDKMLVGGIYKNANQYLPQENGRLWYEADINYKSGKRNGQRILWSNDGLVFVTYDHYETFYEIV